MVDNMNNTIAGQYIGLDYICFVDHDFSIFNANFCMFLINHCDLTCRHLTGRNLGSYNVVS